MVIHRCNDYNSDNLMFKLLAYIFISPKSAKVFSTRFFLALNKCWRRKEKEREKNAGKKKMVERFKRTSGNEHSLRTRKEEKDDDYDDEREREKKSLRLSEM